MMFRDLPRYDGYRGAPGRLLPQVPATWRWNRLASVGRQISEGGHPDLPLLSVYLDRGVIPYAEGGRRVHAPSERLDAYQVVRAGDLVLNNQQAWRGSVGVSAHHGIISPAYVIWRNSSTIAPQYATFLFRASVMVDQFVTASRGVGDIQRDLHNPSLRNTLVPVPPLEDQLAIATYLGHANARIEKAIAAKRRLVALLDERKREVVNRVVTKGLDPDVALVDSGVPWIGLFPEHWGLVPARYIFRPVSRTVTDSALPQLSLTRSVGLVPSGAEGSGTTAAESSGNLQQCARGDFVLNKYRAHMGLFRWCRAPGLVTRNYTVLQPNSHVHHDYFESLFLDPVFAEGLRINARGVGDGMSPLYTSTLMSMKMPLPPPEEQRAIVALIDADTSRFNQQIALTSREIQLLREFRTRLVADVVTGQVDVRAIAATLPDAPESFDNTVSATDDDLGEALNEGEE